jgi:hypothetical protein
MFKRTFYAPKRKTPLTSHEPLLTIVHFRNSLIFNELRKNNHANLARNKNTHSRASIPAHAARFSHAHARARGT